MPYKSQLGPKQGENMVFRIRVVLRGFYAQIYQLPLFLALI